jgi:DNA-binding NtrC family response regulator
MTGSQQTTTQLGDQAAEAARLGPLAVRWLSPGDSGQVSPLEADAVSVGRDAEADVTLNASGVSRLHARFHRQGPIYALHDLSSTNGTYVNGARIQHLGLSENDVLRFGSAVGVVIRLAADRSINTEIQEIAPGVMVSPGLSREFDQLRRAAKSDLPVVLWGETGVGKERLAQALHVMSGRCGAFHGINCAALPPALAEAELFGHRRGAFTGADQPGLGHLRAAHLGTLLLDELSDLPAPLQAKLLRALQEAAVVPLGETRSTPIDVRVVAACQESLTSLVQSNRLRPDLAARLNGLSVEVPPLRKRRTDIALLLGYFLSKHSGGRPPAVEPELLESLLVYAWPGNVRELELVARRLLVLHSQEPVLRRAYLPEELRPAPRQPLSSAPPEASRREHDERLFAVELRRSGGKIAPAAAAANISRQRAYRLLGGRSVAEFLTEFAHDEADDGDSNRST